MMLMRNMKLVLLAVSTLIVAAVAALLLYGGSFGVGKGIAKVGGPFTLVDHMNRTRTDADFRGRYMLVYFGYTYCPDVCPTALQLMTAALAQLPAAQQDRITPVFITIDPERDTIEQLAAYVENFHPGTIGLTGTNTQIADVARSYRVYFAKAQSDDSAADYLMDHSSIIFLMDPDGAYVTHFTHGTPAEKIVARLRDSVKS